MARGPQQSIRPLFRVAASPSETLATICRTVRPRSQYGVASKGLDVFVGVPKLTPELVRALAKLARVHLFTEGKATVWAAEGTFPSRPMRPVRW